MNLVGVEPRLTDLEYRVSDLEDGGGGGGGGDCNWTKEDNLISPKRGILYVSVPYLTSGVSGSVDIRTLTGGPLNDNVKSYVTCWRDFDATQFQLDSNGKIQLIQSGFGFVPIHIDETTIQNNGTSIYLAYNDINRINIADDGLYLDSDSSGISVNSGGVGLHTGDASISLDPDAIVISKNDEGIRVDSDHIMLVKNGAGIVVNNNFVTIMQSNRGIAIDNTGTTIRSPSDANVSVTTNGITINNNSFTFEITSESLTLSHNIVSTFKPTIQMKVDNLLFQNSRMTFRFSAESERMFSKFAIGSEDDYTYWDYDESRMIDAAAVKWAIKNKSGGAGVYVPVEVKDGDRTNTIHNTTTSIQLKNTVQETNYRYLSVNNQDVTVMAATPSNSSTLSVAPNMIQMNTPMIELGQTVQIFSGMTKDNAHLKLTNQTAELGISQDNASTRSLSINLEAITLKTPSIDFAFSSDKVMRIDGFQQLGSDPTRSEVWNWPAGKLVDTQTLYYAIWSMLTQFRVNNPDLNPFEPPMG
jgi:hypothetical protein